MRLAFGFALLAGLAGAAAAQEFTLDRTALYVSDARACAALEEKGLDAWLNLDFLSLSFDSGIQSMEFHCNFFDVKTRPNSNFSFVSAVCEYPGELYPDTFAIAPYDENTIQVVSAHMNALEMAGVFDSSAGEGASAATIYHRCHNLSEIPVD
jgi:hypothetical protein